MLSEYHPHLPESGTQPGIHFHLLQAFADHRQKSRSLLPYNCQSLSVPGFSHKFQEIFRHTVPWSVVQQASDFLPGYNIPALPRAWAAYPLPHLPVFLYLAVLKGIFHNKALLPPPWSAEAWSPRSTPGTHWYFFSTADLCGFSCTIPRSAVPFLSFADSPALHPPDHRSWSHLYWLHSRTPRSSHRPPLPFSMPLQTPAVSFDLE